MVFELGKGLALTPMSQKCRVSKLELGVRTKPVVLSSWVHRPWGWGEERGSRMTPGNLCILPKCGNMLFRVAVLQRGVGNFREDLTHVQEHP